VEVLLKIKIFPIQKNSIFTIITRMSRRMDPDQTQHPDVATDASQSPSRQQTTELSMENKGPQLANHRQETAFDSRYPPHALIDTPSEGRSTKESESASDMEQHCLLFPTYATRHSRSGKRDFCVVRRCCDTESILIKLLQDPRTLWIGTSE